MSIYEVEMHPLWQQRKLRAFCDAKGIHSAYSPLGGQPNTSGASAVLGCEVIKEIAQPRGKTVARV
ncbi:hypothetical protein AMTRI_Chr04g244040 [Amborella trichopoda]